MSRSPHNYSLILYTSSVKRGILFVLVLLATDKFIEVSQDISAKKGLLAFSRAGIYNYFNINFDINLVPARARFQLYN